MEPISTPSEKTTETFIAAHQICLKFAFPPRTALKITRMTVAINTTTRIPIGEKTHPNGANFREIAAALRAAAACRGLLIAAMRCAVINFARCRLTGALANAATIVRSEEAINAQPQVCFSARRSKALAGATIPPPSALAERASREGWIHVPVARR